MALLEKNWEILKKLSKVMDFIEVHYTKDRLETSKILSLKTRWVVHAPHRNYGANLVTGNKMELLEDSIVLASSIGAKYLIIHPGYKKLFENGDILEKAIENVIKLKEFSKDYGVKLLIENTFSHYLNIGYRIPTITSSVTLPWEMRKLLNETKCDFVLDFSHAYITSLNIGTDYRLLIKGFMKLKPKMFHLCDGEVNRKKDIHLPLGKGNFDLPFFISQIKNRDVTLEIKPPTIENFITSKNYMESFLRNLKS